jgi:hypothetical protein
MDLSTINVSSAMSSVKEIFQSSHLNNAYTYNPNYSDDVTKKQALADILSHLLQANHLPVNELQKTASELVYIHSSNRESLVRVFKALLVSLQQAENVYKRVLERYDHFVENLDRCDKFVSKQVVQFIKACDKGYTKMQLPPDVNIFSEISNNVENHVMCPAIAHIIASDGFSEIPALLENLRQETITTNSQLTGRQCLTQQDKIRLMYEYLNDHSSSYPKDQLCHPTLYINYVMYDLISRKLKDGIISVNPKGNIGVQECLDLWYQKMLLSSQTITFKRVVKDLVRFYKTLDDGQPESLPDFIQWFTKVFDCLKKLHNKYLTKQRTKKPSEEPPGGEDKKIKTESVNSDVLSDKISDSE